MSGIGAGLTNGDGDLIASIVAEEITDLAVTVHVWF